MNLSDLDALFENLFAGGYPEEGGPEPINKRFNWVDPKTGKRPPKIPRAALGGGEQRLGVDGKPAAPAAVPVTDMSDRVGRHSLNDLIPHDELATMDQLLDLKLRAQKAQGPHRDSLNREFDAHRSEFESMVKKIVDVIIEGAYERSFNKSVRAIHTGVDKANKKMDQLFMDLPAKRKRNPALAARRSAADASHARFRASGAADRMWAAREHSEMNDNSERDSRNRGYPANEP